MGSYSVTCHQSQVNTPLTPARQAGTRFTYPRGMEGRVALGDWLHTEMVYPHIRGPLAHPSTNPAVPGGSRTRDLLITSLTP